MAAQNAKSALNGRWKIPNVETPVTLQVSGNKLNSVEKPFGNAPLLGEFEEVDGSLGIHITMGGFPMKAWVESDGGSPLLRFSNGGRWTKL